MPKLYFLSKKYFELLKELVKNNRIMNVFDLKNNEDGIKKVRDLWVAASTEEEEVISKFEASRILKSSLWKIQNYVKLGYIRTADVASKKTGETIEGVNKKDILFFQWIESQFVNLIDKKLIIQDQSVDKGVIYKVINFHDPRTKVAASVKQLQAAFQIVRGLFPDANLEQLMKKD